MSFKDANFIAFPIGDWTLDWYAKVMQDSSSFDACLYSILIAVATTIAATIIGVWIALLIASPRASGAAPCSSRSPACRLSCPA